MPELAEPARGLHRLVQVGWVECLRRAVRECLGPRGSEAAEQVVRAAAGVQEAVGRPLVKD